VQERLLEARKTGCGSRDEMVEVGALLEMTEITSVSWWLERDG